MTVPTVWPGSPRVRQSDPIESHAAADLTTGSVAASQAAVLALLERTVRPLKASELEHYLAGQFSPSRVRTALKELEEMGRVECAGTVQSRPGRATMCRVWIAA